MLLLTGLAGNPQPPQPSIPPGVEQIDILLPSEGASGGNLAVRLFALMPGNRTYLAEGAPVVIEAPGGDAVGSLQVPRSQGLEGFVYIEILFPGGRFEGRASEGVYDHRGLNSIKALRDVALFASGHKPDAQGRTIDKIVRVPVLTQNVGLLTLSNGGAITVVTLALYGEQLQNIKYFIDWENPSNAQIVTTDAGPGSSVDCPPSQGRPLGRQRFSNPFYRGYGPIVLDIDYSKIAYDASLDRIFLDGNKNGKYDTVTDSNGCHSTDTNRNGKLDPEEDFGLSPMPYSAPGEKKHFSLQVIQSVRDAKLFSAWPSWLDTPEESENFWKIRDAAQNYDALAKKRSDLKLLILTSVEDHVQTVLGKPHIRQPFEAFVRNKMWVKLNPSRASVSAVDQRLASRSDLPDNAPNTAPADWNNYNYAYPENIPDPIFYAAAVREMAEQVRASSIATNSVLSKPWLASSAASSFTVDATSNVGAVKALNGVQGAPHPLSSSDADLTERFRAAGINIVRLAQDDGFGINGFILGSIFPDANRSADDPAAYNFGPIDRQIESIVKAGATPLWEAMYDIGGGDFWGKCCQAGRPPQDLTKWASVIQHVLMHFNENWANGHSWDVHYVEFINEPCGLGGFNCESADGRQQLWRTYAAFANAIRDYNRKYGRSVKAVGLGNPAGADQFARSTIVLDEFFNYVKTNKLLLDVFSYHTYTSPADHLRTVQIIRQHLNALGFTNVPLWNSEWNWTAGVIPQEISATRDQKYLSAFHAAHNAQTKTLAQDLLSEAIVYRANRGAPRPSNPTPSEYMYFFPDGAPKPAYFEWLIFSQIARETPRRLSVNGPTGTPTLLAGRSEDGKKLELLLSHWTQNSPSTQDYSVRIMGLTSSERWSAQRFVVDRETNELKPIETKEVSVSSDGTLMLSGQMAPWSLHYWVLTKL